MPRTSADTVSTSPRASVIAPGSTFVDRHAAGRHDVGPRHQHALGRDERILRRKHFVQRRGRDDDHQRVAQSQELRAIDGRVDRHAGEPLGRLLLERFVDRVGNILAVLAEQEQIQQAVLERRIVMFDRLRGVGRVDRAGRRAARAGGRRSSRCCRRARQTAASGRRR